MADAPATQINPDQLVEDAIRIASEFESELAAIEGSRKRLVEETIRQGETRAIDKIRAWINKIVARLTNKQV
jgi:hypothetical protein